MRILVVGLATFDEMAGGSARYVSGLVDGLRERGHHVEVRTAAGRVATVGYTERGLAGQLRRALRRIVLVMPGSFAAVLRTRPDLVSSHFALDGLPAVVAAQLARVPVVVTFHGPWALEAVATGRRGRWPGSTWLRRRIERFVYRRAERCLTLSDAFARLLAADYGVDRRRIEVIPGGLDTRRFAGLPTAADARDRLGLAQRHTFVSVRRLVPRMGLDLAIEALSELAPEVDAQLVIAGAGPDRERLEARARSAGLAERVVFLGRVADADLPLVYAAADACVVPSRELEGFGYVALEALASGRAVVAAGIGGLAELVGGLEPRWVVAAEPAAIARALRDVALHPERYPDPAARVAYAATMDWASVLPRVVDVFRLATAERSRSRPARAR